MSDLEDWIDEQDNVNRGEVPDDIDFPDFSGGWNYRMVRREGEHEPVVGIHEVFYDGDGEPRACSKNPVGFMGEEVEDLKNEMDRAKQALNKPVLDYEEF